RTGREHRPRARVSRAAAARRAPSLLLLADHRNGCVLDREHVVPRGALRGPLPDRALADRRVSRLAAVLDDLPRADRVRRHRAGAGADVEAALDDRADRARLRRGALGVHAMVLALRAAPLLRRIGVNGARAKRAPFRTGGCPTRRPPSWR